MDESEVRCGGIRVNVVCVFLQLLLVLFLLGSFCCFLLVSSVLLRRFHEKQVDFCSKVHLFCEKLVLFFVKGFNVSCP